jgi:DNA-binding NarL/FixJ family response regulator
MSGAAPAASPNADGITVVLADDHPALLIGLRALLEQAAGIAVVGEAGDGRAALDLIAATRPTVAVVDCQLPVVPGPEVAAEVRRRGWATRVVALSAYRDERYVRGMVAAGVVGYLVKDEAPAAIAEAVRAAARGEGWFSPAVAAWVGRGAAHPASGPAGLTERERAVLRLVAQGRTNKEIARQLGIAERTVEFHMGNTLRKLDLASRVEAAIWAKDYLSTEP